MASETSTPTDPDPSRTADADGNAFVPSLARYFPESLVAALLLALLALVVTVPSLDPMTQLEMFGTGFFRLFTVQMLLILFWVVSASVVEAPRVGQAFDAVAGALPTSQSGIIYATGFLSLLFGWINWALGLVGGILIGQALCRRAREEGTAVHYPLVLTAGLLSLVITNQGLSSPGGLIMADETGLANFMVADGFEVADVGSIAMAEFVLHPANVVSSALFIVTLPLLLVLLAPDREADVSPLGERNSILEGSIAETFAHYRPARPREEWELGDRLENSLVITAIAVALGLISVGAHFYGGGDLTLPWLAFTLIILGLLVQGPPMAFREKTEDATRWANHVAIPFLLYAAVFALLAESGLYGTIGDAIAGAGIPHALSYVVAFVLGLLVPDPGSLWVILGPALAAADVGLVESIVAVMYGAGVSNLWLSFIFAGILSLYGFDWREFAKYAGVVTVYVSVVVLALLVIL